MNFVLTRSGFALTRSLRSLRLGELIVLRAPAEPAPSADIFCRQPVGPAAPAWASAGQCL